MKICSRCGTEKPLVGFYKSKANRDGLQTHCKACDKAKVGQWRTSNEETSKAQAIARTKRWVEGNRGKANMHAANYRAAKSLSTPAWANAAAIALVYEEAAFATEFFAIPFHVDHIVPLQHELVCGLHCEANLRSIEGIENLRKSNSVWPDMP